MHLHRRIIQVHFSRFFGLALSSDTAGRNDAQEIVRPSGWRRRPARRRRWRRHQLARRCAASPSRHRGCGRRAPSAPIAPVERAADEGVHLGDVRRPSACGRCRSPRPARRRRPASRAVAPSGSEPASCRPTTSSVRRRRARPRSRRRRRSATSPAAQCRRGLGAHDGVALAVVGAALGMADDHVLRAGILQHLGARCRRYGRRSPSRGNPGRRPRSGARAARPAARCSVAGGQISSRSAPAAPPRSRRSIAASLRRGGAQAVHLPVSGHQRLFSYGHAGPLSRGSRACLSARRRAASHTNSPWARWPAAAAKRLSRVNSGASSASASAT